MKKLFVVLVALTLLVPGAARAKWTGDLRMCGANGCRTIERHLTHDEWPLLSQLVPWPSNSGPAPPGPYYRLTIVPVGGSSESEPIYLVPNAFRTRNTDGRGGAYWVRLSSIPEKLATAARELRPFPAPRVTRVVVGRRAAKEPHTYLRLFRLASPRQRVRDPAAPRPSEQPTTREIVSYWERVRSHFIPIELSARRETPWSDFRTSLWIGKRHDLLLRDGELVRIPHALAERVRDAQSLRMR